MKQIILLILVLFLASCKVAQTNQKINIQANSLNYNVILPENWKPILDSHDLLSYSPKYLGDIFYKNIIRIYRTKLAENENTSLKEFVDKNIAEWNERISIDSQSITTIKTKHGKTFIYKYEHDNYIDTTKYFKHNGSFYRFSYSSDKKFYKKYLNDANFIFNNLKFKKNNNGL